MHIYPWQMDPPWPIEHRCLEYHYPKLGRSIYIEQCTYTHGRLAPWSIENRCLEYCYTKLGRSIYIEPYIYTHGRKNPPLQWSIDALNTATRNLTSLMADLYIYRTMHIYPWQMDPLAIEHRCLDYCYTKLGSSIYIENTYIPMTD